jgi:hypothetical protein
VFLSGDTSRRFVSVLLFIVLAAAIPALMLGTSQYIEYDGYWHVFIAQQDNWSRFWRDIATNAHPPLFFLLLKAMLHLGHSLLVYRSISLATGIASVGLVGWIARKVTGSDTRAWQSALLYGFALPAIIMACEVRSYMLSTFCVLLSFSSLLDLADTAELQNKAKSRAGYAVWAILACLSHYFAFFYCGASMAILAGRFIIRKFQRRKASWLAEAATLLPIVAAIATLYLVHAGNLAEIQGHLLPYYHDPAGAESAAAFLLRNNRNLLNLFLPWRISSDVVALVLSLCAFATGLIAIRGAVSARPTWTLLTTWMMLGAIALAAIAGKYPFGGDLRQQYILFPFFVLCLAIVVERAVAGFAPKVPVPGRALANALMSALIVIMSLRQFSHYPKSGGNVLADRLQRFNQVEPAPAAVYLDQFNLITFFIYHHDWKWTLEKQQPIDGIDIYRLRKGDQTMLVLRDKQRWNLDPEEADFYGQMPQFLRTWKIAGGITVFDIRQIPPGVPYPDLKIVRASIAKKAFDAALCLPRNWVDSTDWFATFAESGCQRPAPVPVQVAGPVVEPTKQAKGRFDDKSDVLEYVGKWTHDGKLSSSSDAGAVVRLSFEGTEINWTYAKGPDRGIAAVRIDGKPRPNLDLYSAKQVAGVSSYGDLIPGKHTFELIVTGKKAPEATDRVIDLDALSVP